MTDDCVALVMAGILVGVGLAGFVAILATKSYRVRRGGDER